MYRRLVYLTASFIGILGFTVSETNAIPLQQDGGQDGIVSTEAESYDANVPQSGDTWVRVVRPIAGFNGAVGMQVLPNDDTGTRKTNYAARSPRLDYQVKFAKTGTHYIWIHGYGATGNDDSCHAGLDGREIDTCDNISGFNNVYAWSGSADGARATVDVPSAGIHTFNIWMREDGFIIDKIVLTTNPNYTPKENGPPESPRGPRIKAFAPNPYDKATDVPQDVILTWAPAVNAVKHDVYLGNTFADVNAAGRTNHNNVLFSQNQDANSYDPPGLLEFSKTYYWRIDEVNASPTSKVQKGDIWSFTVEPFVHQIKSIKASASSSYDANMTADKTIDGSGLNANDQHATDSKTLWLSSETGAQPTWVKFEFDKVYTLHEMWVWNFNQSAESNIGLGLKKVTIEYSTDGTNWAQLSGVPEFAQAPGSSNCVHNTSVNFGSVQAKHVRITALNNWKGTQQYGLSEVRFFYTLAPVKTR